MIVHFYIPINAQNDATSYYVNLVRTALFKNSIKTVDRPTLSFNVNKNDYVFVIRIRDYYAARKLAPAKKIIFWSQGIGPEEYYMVKDYSFKSFLISKVYDRFEKHLLKNAFHTIAVSNSMITHYENKHSLKIQNSTVIPCYNKSLQKMAFKELLKNASSYVFVDSIFAWQCFEKTLEVYKEVELLNPDSNLTVFTKDQDLAKQLINKYKIKNYRVDYISLKDLEKELLSFKYGFLLRDKDIINNVSTPTKMNGYLAVGLIPIYTDVIDDFNDKLHLKEFEIKLSYKMRAKDMAAQVAQHDKKHIDYDQFCTVVQENFFEYYDDGYNIKELEKNLISKM